MQITRERFEWVDYAKGIGILLVVYGHVARGLVNAGLMLDSSLFQYVDSIIYSFHMPLFFFLSGLFLVSSIRSKGFNNVFNSKIDTVFYPYVIWSLFQGGIEITLSNYTNGNVTAGEVLSLFTSPRAQFWFLYALLLVFISSLIVLRMVGVKGLPIFFILSIALYLWVPNLSPCIQFIFISESLVFFLLGAVFQRSRLLRYNNVFILTVVLLMSIIGQYLYHQPDFNQTSGGIFLLGLSVISIMAIVSLSEWLSRFNLSFMAYVGASSMAIYLMHILAGSGIRVILNKVLGVDSLMLHLILGTFLGVLLPLVVLKLINYFKFPYAFSFPISGAWANRRDK
jgi:fucose 4-O-acetylase-like acetyltransferase